MKNGKLPVIPCILISLLTLTYGFRVQGGSSGEAEKAFQEGTRRFRGGDFEAAAEAFRKAHALRPNWKILYNIGQSAAAAKRYGPALEAFERYLVLGGDDIEPGRRDEVLEEMAKLKPIVGSAAISGPDGLVLVIDGWERGTTPLSGPVLVAGGIDHRLEARSGDEVVFSKTFRVNGEERTALALEAKEQVKQPEAASQPQKTATEPGPVEAAAISSEARPNRLGIAGWSLVGVGAATLIGSAVTGGMALSLDKTLEQDCGDGGCPPDKTADREKMNRLALTTDVLIGVGATVAAAGLVLVGVAAAKKKKEGREAKAVALPCLAPGRASIMFVKEF